MSYGDGYDFHKVNRGTVPSFTLVLCDRIMIWK